MINISQVIVIIAMRIVVKNVNNVVMQTEKLLSI